MNSSTGQVCKFEGEQIPQANGEQKKQVRRRRQSRRLYKEMPLNMAEARREIVTALKLHRASTKQKQQQPQINQPLPLLCPCFEPPELARIKSRRNPRIYPSCSYNCSVYLENGSDFSHFGSSSSPIIAPPPPPAVEQNLNMEFPIQTLDPNLYFDDDFGTVDTCSVVCDDNSLSFLPNNFPSGSYAATHQELPESILLSGEKGNLMASDMFWSSNNVPIEESQKEIHGEVNEINKINGHHSFDKSIEFPDWLNINDEFLQHHSNYHCNEDRLQDPDLSCMDIGEIEDVDADWLV